MDKNLIFDLGFHNGDTSYVYLSKGYKVVGVDCAPNLIIENKCRYNADIEKGKLILVEKCITEKDGDTVSFYLSKFPLWNSANINIAERHEKSTEIKVETTTLKTLIETYGCPYYCKIDIEGYDVFAVRSLNDVEEKPKFISVEAECLGKGEKVTINLVDELYKVGYRKFFFVNQYNRYPPFEFEFDKEYEWIDYEGALNELKEYQKIPWEFGVWADIYATY